MSMSSNSVYYECALTPRLLWKLIVLLFHLKNWDEKKLTAKELKIEDVEGRETRETEQRRFHTYHEITREFTV